METMTTAANRILLNNRCEFWFDGTNVSAPLAACLAKQLPAVLDALGGDVVAVEFNTVSDPDGLASDLKKYGKRLSGIGANWSRTEWAPKAVRGFTLDGVYTCTLRRNQ